jgi:alpha-D-ribose 1-methylphosphonate 5-triphosphate synthase subunit PhnG
MDRTERCELLAQLTDAEIERLARLVLDGRIHAPTLITAPTVGMVMVRVAEGAHGDVFNFGEVLVTECHVRIGQAEGWSMVMGSRPDAALRAASIDAVLATGAIDATELDDRLLSLARTRREAVAAERAHLVQTRVQFQTQ